MPDAAEISVADPRHIRYVFVDIVGYSTGRTVEAQGEVVACLNQIIRTTLGRLIPNEEHYVLLPTGDGVCIAIANPLLVFDVHVQIALELLGRLHDYNATVTSLGRNIELRVGLNENTDNLITDINGGINVAGPGINLAQRVMGLGEAGCILVSEPTYNILRHREKYMDRFHRYEAVVKHDEKLVVYQYVAESEGVTTEKPPALMMEEDPIEAELRVCLDRMSRSGGEASCLRQARQKYDAKRDELIERIKVMLNDEQKINFTSAMKYRRLATSKMDEVEKWIVFDAGTMRHVLWASERLQASKALVEELTALHDRMVRVV